MSTPENNWEVYWRETLAEHKASPPSANDWAGMEQLLDATIVPVNAVQASNTGSSGAFITSSIPWPVWVIALISLLALGYWLGSRTRGVIGHEEQPLPAKQVPMDIINSTSASTAVDNRLSNSTNTNNFSPNPGPVLNTPTLSGGVTNGTPPPAMPPVKDEPKAKITATAGFSRASEELLTAPASPPPANKVRRIRLKYSSTLPSIPPPIPTEFERWEQRVDELLQSDKLVITPPSRINNGHFPAYRRWN